MTYDDSTQRTRLIAGLRELADYLESNPEVPAPSYSDVLTFPAKGNWAEMCAEIDATAARLGVTTYENGCHYVAARTFGPVEYRAVAIPPKNDSGNEESE
jgi:hypothetical protein